MKPENLEKIQHSSKIIIEWLSHAFDVVADWVTAMPWWRFLLYSVIAMIAAAILQETVFSSKIEETTISQPAKKRKPPTPPKVDLNVHIDENGVHIKKVTPTPSTPTVTATAPPASAAVPPPPVAPLVAKPPKSATGEEESTNAATDAAQAAKEAAEAAREATEALHAAVKQYNEISEKANEEALDAANAAVEEKVTHYRNESSEWFKKFVILSVFALFGTKALMGGKKRAETQAAAAREVAEREALQRQVSEAKMQMMQAQVEPHFLFNTLASVEYLIETDPPRASLMQRSLIKYLRAVLPQIREMTPSTNLGREADIVSSYLDLLKMRMEERLTIQLNIPASLRNAAFPPMMLQPLVENAIKHGLECKEQGGTLSIDAEVIKDTLRIRVADDGVGFGVMPSDGTGLGLTSIRERLTMLHGNLGQLIIEPNQPGGVIAIIEVPYQVAS
ncbi:MAG: hypothetical protein RL748_191 [Pseudomonadota bacterium]|jgi:signal transduction histidine kinase